MSTLHTLILQVILSQMQSLAMTRNLRHGPLLTNVRPSSTYIGFVRTKHWQGLRIISVKASKPFQ